MLEDICVYTATLYRLTVEAERIEGEREERLEPVGEFDCVVFPPGESAAGIRWRVVEDPTLMHYGEMRDGAVLSLQNADELVLTDAPGLPEQWLGRYQLAGPPQPLGKPGEDLIGEYARLRRVETGGALG